MAVTSGAVGFEGHRWLPAVRAATSAALRGATAPASARSAAEVSAPEDAATLARDDDTVSALRSSVDRLRADLESLRGANAAAVARLVARLDTQPSAPTVGPDLSEVTARLDRLDRDPRLTEVVSRLDRIEHGTPAATATAGSAIQARAAGGRSTVSQSAPAGASRSVLLDNWVVRDVYSGIALVEGRTGSVREVMPGETLPGAGEVRSIQRHGRGWLVLTSRGVIGTEVP